MGFITSIKNILRGIAFCVACLVAYSLAYQRAIPSTPEDCWTHDSKMYGGFPDSLKNISVARMLMDSTETPVWGEIVDVQGEELDTVDQSIFQNISPRLKTVVDLNRYNSYRARWELTFRFKKKFNRITAQWEKIPKDQQIFKKTIVYHGKWPSTPDGKKVILQDDYFPCRAKTGSVPRIFFKNGFSSMLDNPEDPLEKVFFTPYETSGELEEDFVPDYKKEILQALRYNDFETARTYRDKVDSTFSIRSYASAMAFTREALTYAKIRFWT